MTRYEQYKDSGSQWLGEIPSHWEVKKLGNYLTLFSEKGFPDAQLLSVTREKGVIIRDKDNKEENHNFVPDDLSGYKHLRAGDFVINKMKSWQGSYGVSDYDGIVSPAYFTCKLKGINKDFFSRAIRAKIYTSFFMQYSKGIRVDQWDLEPIEMKSIPFVVPPECEQAAIVSYLDSVTAKIDEAIAQQQKMIDLLNERKQIIIQNAVTKGLDSSAKMKDSGIDWIGEIPEEWEIRKIKTILDNSSYGIKIGPFGSSFTGKVVDEGSVKVYGQWNITSGFTAGKNYISEDSFRNLKSYQVFPGDILISMMGTIGKCKIVPDNIQKGVMDSHVVKIRLNTRIINPKYFEYIYDKDNSLVVYTNMQYLKKGSIMDGLNSSTIKELLVCVPPLGVQESIIKHLDMVTPELDTAIDRYRNQISLLRERKQIIINDVVTGKIKVS